MASGGAPSPALAALLLLVCCASVAAATKYTVGDTSGWTTTGDYATWASGKKFEVGDTLVFNYAGGTHTVDEVSASDYAACSSSKALSTDSAGSTTVTLKTAGKHYFICGVATHCSSGMKLVVDVAKAAAAPKPAPAPAPVQAPAPTADTTTPDAPDTTPDTPSTSPSSSDVTPKTPVTVLSPPGKKSTSGAAELGAAAWAGLVLSGLVAAHLAAF